MTRPYPSLSHWERIWGEEISIKNIIIINETISLYINFSKILNRQLLVLDFKFAYS